MKYSDIKKIGFLICFLTFNFQYFAFSQVTIIVNETPDGTDKLGKIFLSGNFNNWIPNDEKYTLDEAKSITFYPKVGNLEFKFTLGSWGHAEGNKNGAIQNNHSYNYDGSPDTLYVPIYSWVKSKSKSDNHTFTNNTFIISDSFYIAGLNRYRRVWIYLPPDYNFSSKLYPVFYMHDGQNLFDAATAYADEWQVDESMNDIFNAGNDASIIVGIDNGGQDRFNEMSPWIIQNYGGGQGNEFADFLVNQLKPYIDNNYRTKPDRSNTGILGSSMGAIISLYTGMKYPHVFSKIGVFSPSFWVVPQIYSYISKLGKQEDTKIFMSAGDSESDDMLTDLYAMKTTLINSGFNDDDVYVSVVSNGKHNEALWAKEFPEAYKWLFNNISSRNETHNGNKIELYPLPADSNLYVTIPHSFDHSVFQLFSNSGKLLIQKGLPTSSVDVSKLEAGEYLVNILYQNKIIFSQFINIK